VQVGLIPDASFAANLSPIKLATSCKICGEPAALHGVVDFNKTCEVHRGRFFPLSGVPVWYHRCTNCQFLFTEQLDHWNTDMFRQHIYNGSYADVDPDANGARARANSGPLINFVRQVNAKRLLDYGGGDGTLARILVENGFDAVSWDPMRDDKPAPPAGGFDLVTAFEVLEHTPTPLQTSEQVLSFLHAGGLFLFSTLTLDALSPQSCDNWYIAPRNGHISIHTSRSLDLLFARLDRKVHHFGSGFHLAHPIPQGSGSGD
jgi:hypothetical protein